MAMRTESRSHPTFERGAAATIVAILLGGGVLLGSAALAIDVGNLMFERRQLQNAADATSASLASACAKDINACDDDERAAALKTLSAANASDASAQLDTREYEKGQCGRVADAPDMPECTSTGDIADLGECPPLPDWVADSTINYVETYTLTETPGGDSHLLPYFGAGDGTEVGACARTAWGPAGSGTATIPVTFSQCEWEDATPPTTAWGTEVALSFNLQKDAPCKTWEGHNFPGSFGWLDHDTGTCSVEIDDLGWVGTGTGIGDANDCGAWIENLVGEVVYLPIFDCFDDADKDCDLTEPMPTGSKAWYRIAGFAAFHLTAVDVTGVMKESEPGYPSDAAKAMCKDKGGFCLYGWFIDDWVDQTGEIDPDGNDFGAVTLQPIG